MSKLYMTLFQNERILLMKLSDGKEQVRGYQCSALHDNPYIIPFFRNRFVEVFKEFYKDDIIISVDNDELSIKLALELLDDMRNDYAHIVETPKIIRFKIIDSQLPEAQNLHDYLSDSLIAKQS